MARRPLLVLPLLAALVLAAWPPAGSADDGGDAARGAGRFALLLEFEGAVGPATADYLNRAFDDAAERGAELVIVRMDTPGGLDSSMRDIIRTILASPVPIVVWVAPPGSRAASAGTYILYASHVAAMAPATNLGAATPVRIGGTPLPGGDREPEPAGDREPASDDAPARPAGETDGDSGTDGDDSQRARAAKPAATDEEPAGTPGGAMERKAINDAVAYIQGLARLRGRNVEWAESAVREAVSVSSDEALDRNIIDLIAGDTDELLDKLDGREVSVAGRTVTLATAGIAVESVEPDWRSELLAVITNPNVAYILMLLGIYGLFFELSNPGGIFPGVAGAICLLLALYAFQVLPVNYAGLALIVVGIGFIVAEVFVSSFGILGVGGAVAFVVGSLILMDTPAEVYRLSTPLVVSAALVMAGFLYAIVHLAVRQRRRPVVSGREALLASTGEVLEAFEGGGQVRVQGEIWQARSERPLARGQAVHVTGVDGLTLQVEPATDKEREP